MTDELLFRPCYTLHLQRICHRGLDSGKFTIASRCKNCGACLLYLVYKDCSVTSTRESEDCMATPSSASYAPLSHNATEVPDAVIPEQQRFQTPGIKELYLIVIDCVVCRVSCTTTSDRGVPDCFPMR